MSKQDKAPESANSIIDCPLTRRHTRRIKLIKQASAVHNMPALASSLLRGAANFYLCVRGPS